MKISIPYKIKEQIQFFVGKSDVEVSGLGKVIITPDGYKVTEVCLLKQENTSVHTEIDAQAVTKAMFDLRLSEGGIYFWWHSHVNMGVFWSGTDVATIEEIGRNGLCVAVVFNKKKEMRGAVWLKGSELSPNMYFDDVKVSIEHEGASEETKALWAADFDAKCKAKEYAYSGNYDYSHLRQAQSQVGVNPLMLAREAFDLMSFEETLPLDVQQQLSFFANGIMYGYCDSEVDKCLGDVLALLKGAKAGKHDKKKAYKEYKEMALEQKNYLKANEAKFEVGYNA